MALYLGNGERIKITSNNVAHCLNLFSEKPITNGIRLVSSDDYTLQDTKRLYLTTKKEEE